MVSKQRLGNLRRGTGGWLPDHSWEVMFDKEKHTRKYRRRTK